MYRPSCVTSLRTTGKHIVEYCEDEFITSGVLEKFDNRQRPAKSVQQADVVRLAVTRTNKEQILRNDPGMCECSIVRAQYSRSEPHLERAPVLTL